MPLIIGEINARIEIERPGRDAGPGPDRDDEKRRQIALSAERFERERRVEQRDPDLLGAR